MAEVKDEVSAITNNHDVQSLDHVIGANLAPVALSKGRQCRCSCKG